jgi:hypothetical protein
MPIAAALGAPTLRCYRDAVAPADPMIHPSPAPAPAPATIRITSLRSLRHPVAVSLVWDKPAYRACLAAYLTLTGSEGGFCEWLQSCLVSSLAFWSRQEEDRQQRRSSGGANAKPALPPQPPASLVCDGGRYFLPLYDLLSLPRPVLIL